jgi:membrane protein
MRLSSRVKERLALLVMSLIGQRFYRNQAAWTMEELATQIGLPLTAVEIVVSAIEQHGVIAKTDDEPARYVPARPLDTFSVKELLDVVRADGEVPPLSADHLPAEPVVDGLLERMDHAEQESLDAGTLKDLALVPPRTLDTNQEPSTPPDATAGKRT